MAVYPPVSALLQSQPVAILLLLAPQFSCTGQLRRVARNATPATYLGAHAPPELPARRSLCPRPRPRPQPFLALFGEKAVEKARHDKL